MTDEQVQEIIYNDLGFCGCGQPEVVLEFVHKALQLINQRAEADFDAASHTKINEHFRFKNDNLFYWMAWYFLDRSDLIEHGIGVAASWLTEKGKAFLQYLDSHPLDQALKA